MNQSNQLHDVKFLVDAALMQQIAQYLVLRPFNEVHAILRTLEALQPFEAQEKPPARE